MAKEAMRRLDKRPEVAQFEEGRKW